MPDEDRPYGTGARRSRHSTEEASPDQQPRRRRRSMEDSGGVSVSDLVKRHSRTDLPIPQVNGAAANPVAAQQTQTRAPQRAAREAEPVPPTPKRPQAQSRPAAPRKQAQVKQTQGKQTQGRQAQVKQAPGRQAQAPRPEQMSQQMPRPEVRPEPRRRAAPAATQQTGQRPAPAPPRDATGQRPLPPNGQMPPNPAPRPTAQASGTYQVPPSPRGHTSGPRPMPQNSAVLPAPVQPQQNGHPHGHANGHTGQHQRPPRPPQPSQQMPIPNAGHTGRQQLVPPSQQPGQMSAQMSAQLPIPPVAEHGIDPNGGAVDRNPSIPPALKRPEPPAERKPLPPRRDVDAISMTTEMEAISEPVKEIRRVDATLARFSAVHDELAEEERLKKEKRERMMPWLKAESGDDEEPDVLAAAPAAGTIDPRVADAPTVDQHEPVEPTVHLEPAESPASSASNLDAEPPEPVRRTAGGGGTRKPPRSKYLRTGKIIAASIAGLLLVGSGAVWGGKEWIDGQFNEVAALDENSSDIQQSEAQRGDENFLMVGSDTRAGAEAEDGVGSADNIKGARSDTIMIAHVPKDRKRVVMVSFPRDLEVQIPECDKYDSEAAKYTDQKSKPLKNQKINVAYFLGGPKCVTKVVQNLTGLKINHFVGIDFHGFKGMVDAVQGVEMCVEKPMWDNKLNTWIVEKPGENVMLQGDAALNFVRARHVSTTKGGKEDPTSDYGRIKRQQRFLSSLLRKSMSGQVLLDPGKLKNFVSAFTKATFGEGVDTDQLITLGRSLASVQAGKVTFITVPTVGESNDRGNEVLRDKDNKALFNAIINKAPLPGEQEGSAPQAQAGTTPQAAQAQQGQVVDPKSVKVQVLNAGAKDGEARRAQTSLRNLGYQVLQAVDSGAKRPDTVVRFGTDLNGATTVASSIPGAKLEKDDSLGGAVQVLLGQDYSGKVQAPSQATAGTPVPGTTTPPPAAEAPKGLATVNAGDVKCA
nr:LCP family protein [Kibdelosporangium sp. MJ126-NF4]CEL12712.1 Cell envelope-associated transcriptional attenuator LytR-CpsA-Psr, subfamily A1 (as in PMID19099556) [Kibdelosporangium sp. MJ126-NF4]CTQ93576.1 Cell envelope-associated transcriptional attenuator LytR-CpsA-Psr, subfamily A1 (as in PMID19099556) [Kibdelosporangium sp. MJ126-NF4]